MSFEIWMLVGGMYLVMTITLSTLVGFLNVVSGALDKMDRAKNQLKWGPLDFVVCRIACQLHCVYVFHRVDTVLILSGTGLSSQSIFFVGMRKPINFT